jgi:regulator of protease activity HflC (stomatin/prohibitin superfamily)
MNLTLIVIIALAALVVLVWLAGLRVINEYERGVVFRLGRYHRVAAPGLRYVLPRPIDKLLHVDVRTYAVEAPSQEVMTLDNVLVGAVAVAYLQVVDPRLAVTEVADYRSTAGHLLRSTLRSVIGQVTLQVLLTERERVNGTLTAVLDEQTEAWGVRVSTVEIKDVELSQSMLRALGRQAEAEREKIAKIISAEGELEAARTLTDAAGVIGSSPSALQLRYLQTLSEIGGDHNTVVVFPMPIDLVQPLLDLQARMAKKEPNGHEHPEMGNGASHAPPGS